MKPETSKSFEAYSNSPYSSIKHSSYFHVYDRYFSRFIGQEIIFVEIGVLNGGSLFMWREFFGKHARIIGIELNPEAKKWEKDGFEIYIGSQSDPNFWEAFFSEVGQVDVVLDDGGHTFEQQIVTAECCIPNIKSGGLLVTEDVHTSYMSHFGGPSPNSFVSYAKNKIDGINYRFGDFAATKEFEKDVSSISFAESFVIFEVDRNTCFVSEPTDNGKENEGARDYRFRDWGHMSGFARKPVWKSLSSLPLIGIVMRGIGKMITKRVAKLRHNFAKSRLRKHFRY
jgi:hypothetical protein